MAETDIRVGDLRSRVYICERRQAPAADGSIAETFAPLATVYAKVEPIGDMTFWGAQQTDTPVTHRITMRWLDMLSPLHVIMRESLRPNNDVRTELFRVRRIKELQGRMRWVVVAAELEVRQ